jgi:hypothetical protein
MIRLNQRFGFDPIFIPGRSHSSTEGVRQMSRSSLAALLAVSLVIGAVSGAEDKRMGYDDLVDLAKKIVASGMYEGVVPQIWLEPQAGKAKDVVVLTTAEVQLTDSLNKITQERRIVFDDILQYVTENELYKPIFRKNETLKSALKAREKIGHEMILVWASTQTTEKKLDALRTLRAKAKESTWDAFMKYATEKGYELPKPVEIIEEVKSTENRVSLDTDPAGGKICMMCATDYYLYKFQGMDPDAELAKHVLPKTVEVSMSGKYFYMIIGPDGKKSGVGKIHLQQPGTFKLVAPGEGV